MGVLMVLLTVLKIILIIVLVLLVLLMLITALLLFPGLDYGIKARYGERFDMVVRLKWLFGLVKFSATVKNGDLSFKVKLPFGLENKLVNGKEDFRKVDVEKKVENETEAVTEAVAEAVTDAADVGSELSDEPKAKSKCENTTSYKKNEKNKRVKSTNKSRKNKEKNNIFKQIKNFKKAFKEKWEQYNISQLIPLVIKLIKDLLRSLGVKKCNVNGVVGFSDPSQTGMLLGVIGMVCVYLPGEVIFKGNFEKADFKCNGVIEGKTSLLRLLIPLIKFIFEKPVLKIIIDYFRKENV